MGTLGLLGLAALVFLLAYGATRYLCSPAAWLRQLDHPNERSLHAMPTPRTGGLAILASIVVGLAVSQALFANGQGSATNRWIIGAALLLGAVSFWDDRIGLPPGLRFAVHSVAAVAVVVWWLACDVAGAMVSARRCMGSSTATTRTVPEPSRQAPAPAF